MVRLCDRQRLVEAIIRRGIRSAGLCHREHPTVEDADDKLSTYVLQHVLHTLLLGSVPRTILLSNVIVSLVCCTKTPTNF